MFPQVAVDWCCAMASGGQILPMTGRRLRSVWRVRSGLTAFHELPRSSLRSSLFVPRYRREGLWGLMMNGVSQLKRNGASSLPSTGLMLTRSLVRRSSLTMPPYCDSP